MSWCPVLKPLLTPHLTIGTMNSDFRWELNLPASSTPVPRAEAHKHMFSRFPKAAGYWGVLHFASLQEEIVMTCTTSCLGSYSTDSTGWPQISPSHPPSLSFPLSFPLPFLSSFVISHSLWLPLNLSRWCCHRLPATCWVIPHPYLAPYLSLVQP